jgi:two-component system NtrC family response regulator
MSQRNRNAKLRIVLLEDNDNVRTLLEMLLTHRGYEVISFSKPTVCPLQIQPACRCKNHQSCTDVIMTDLNMPGMDGIRFIENLKKKNCKCRHVAVMSGDLNAEAMYQAVKLGCSAFEKPLDNKTLFSWLDNIERTGQYSSELCDWIKESPLSAAG